MSLVAFWALKKEMILLAMQASLSHRILKNIKKYLNINTQKIS